MAGYLRELRKAAGLSQVELAKKSGISRTTISFLENNAEKRTTTTTLNCLAQALGVTADVFFQPERAVNSTKEE